MSQNLYLILEGVVYKIATNEALELYPNTMKNGYKITNVLFERSIDPHQETSSIKITRVKDLDYMNFSHHL